MLSCESALLLAAGAPDSFSSSAVASASSSLCPTPCFWLLRLPGGDGVLAPVAFSMLTPNDPRTGRREQSNGYLQEWYHHIPAAETVAVSQADSQLFHGPAPFRVSYFAHTPRAHSTTGSRSGSAVRRSRSGRTRTCIYMYSGMQVICRIHALLNHAGSQVSSRTKPHISSSTCTGYLYKN